MGNVISKLEKEKMELEKMEKGKNGMELFLYYYYHNND
jgi:hypothetical protein